MLQTAATAFIVRLYRAAPHRQSMRVTNLVRGSRWGKNSAVNTARASAVHAPEDIFRPARTDIEFWSKPHRVTNQPTRRCFPVILHRSQAREAIH